MGETGITEEFGMSWKEFGENLEGTEEFEENFGRNRKEL